MLGRSRIALFPAVGPRGVTPDGAPHEQSPRDGSSRRAQRSSRRAGARWGGASRWQAWRRPSWGWLGALVALSAFANLLVLIAQAPSLARGLYLNADNATALVLPALSGHAPPGAVVNLGDHPWYEPWWYMRATAGLPGYHQLWEIAPILLGLLGIAAVTACAWSALGPLGGVLCGTTLIAASETLRGDLYTPEVHGLVVLHLGVLCGALLIVNRWAAARQLTPLRLAALGIPFVIFTGAGLTDQLLLVSGLGPFVLAPLICWLRRVPGSRALAAFALGTALLAGLVALLLAHVMQEQHVVHAPFPIDFVAPAAIVNGLQNLVVAFLTLGGGAFFGESASGASLFTFIAGVLILIALGAVLRALWGAATASVDAVPASTSGGAAASSPHGNGVGGQVAAGRGNAAAGASRELFLAFWGLVLVFVLSAFALTQLSGDVTNTRYLLGAWAALAALLGILAVSTATRVALLAGVTLFAALNVRAELATGVPPSGPAPGLRIAGEIERFAAAHGASVGYGGYWDSAPVTWETHQRVELFPIQACDAGSGWCVFYGAQISSWYVPRPGAHTFLLTDSRPGIPLTVTAAPTSFGHPIAGESLGEGLTIYIYKNDLAAYLAP